MARIIQLTFSRLDIYPNRCETVFLDGASYGAHPHETSEYRALAKRLGYGSDINRYCAHHEFCHSFLAEQIDGCPSRVLWPLAHGKRGHPGEIIREEALCLEFQGFLTGAYPTMAATAPGIDRYMLKAKALELLSTAMKQAA